MGYSLKFLGPSENSSPLLVSQAGYGPGHRFWCPKLVTGLVIGSSLSLGGLGRHSPFHCIHFHCIVSNPEKIGIYRRCPPWKNFCGRPWSLYWLL